MKKPYFLIALFTAVIIVTCLLGYRFIADSNKTKSEKEYQATLELVTDINQNSDFGGLELLKLSNNKENQPSQGTSDILPKFAEDAKDGVEGIYFNYPYDSNDYRLSKISITQVPYHIYGITEGQNLNEAALLLEDKGFTLQETISDNDVDFVLYRQHHVSISLKVGNGNRTISTIIVSVYDKLDDAVY
ncbi:hypothetical protein acsn021_17510 [Anaerocolumna cellulosilytica]|uniref:Uncharacterized protein n=1 Tax=Anaerocolumna cellulosilytica TaxID=433286 RepID=A0A6S6R3W9_9FIRM|nr:hypothetical protein [Anaerocolumna cellulosilytica]MBB5194855.1 flagellin-like hook-associated protein FlgL [Anaerocolumna cellulosilytica]BCJ94182.1 hypothetical protein acsn021_17510 [Anaerocolumna cellulosilytica]